MTDGRTSIEDYLHVYQLGGSAAVWMLIQDRCLTDHERRRELDRLKAAGWFVLPHFESNRSVEMDQLAVSPPA